MVGSIPDLTEFALRLHSQHVSVHVDVHVDVHVSVHVDVHDWLFKDHSLVNVERLFKP